MGTWDHGLWDNDAALDSLGDVTHQIVEDIGGASSAGQLAAAIGILLQLSPYDFSDESASAAVIADALKEHADSIATLSLPAREVLGQIAGGRGEELARRRAATEAGEEALLHVSGAGFGVREAALFAGEEAEAYVQEVADRCIEMVDDDFSDETLWDDLCREAVGMGGLGTLLALTPCHIPRSRIEKWRDAAAEGLARLEQRNDEEVGFQRPYHANLSRVFRVLLSRSAG